MIKKYNVVKHSFTEIFLIALLALNPSINLWLATGWRWDSDMGGGRDTGGQLS